MGEADLKPRLGDVVQHVRGGPRMLIVDTWRRGTVTMVVCALPNWTGPNLRPRQKPNEQTYAARHLNLVYREGEEA